MSELESEKRGVAFVKVVDGRFDAELSQQPDSADAEYLFLDDPGFRIAAVKMSRDKAIDVRVLGYVRIEQVKGNTADAGEPRLGNNFAAAHMDADRHPLSVFANDRRNRQLRLEEILKELKVSSMNQVA